MTLLWVLLIFIFVILFIIYSDFRIAANRNYPWIDHQSNFFLKWHNKNYVSDLDKIKEELFCYPHEEMVIQATDGISLHGYLFKSKESQKTMICFHGYRFNCFKEYASLAKAMLEHSYNVVLVDMRAHQQSGGRYITFGYWEQADVESWIQYIVNRFPTQDIYLHGTSMGASSVLLCSSHKLPQQVKAAVADCGYSSAWKMIESFHYKIFHFRVPGLLYLSNNFFRIFAHTDLRNLEIPTYLERAKIPILFIHGDQDQFVPCHMSKLNYQACCSYKALLIVQGANHGRSFTMNSQLYLETMFTFFDQQKKN